MVTIESIIAKAKNYLTNFDEERVLRAYRFAEKAHEGQLRKSGEPYLIHPLNVTDILLDFKPDEDAIVCALLHDVAEDTTYTLEDIEAQFGPVVKDLCWGMVKLSKVRSKLDDPQTENLRKLFLAMAKDFRVVLLKLCDRLHNMQTLEFVHPEKRKRIAQETLNIYAPIAARLGIYRLKSQLEDLCFQYVLPEAWREIQEQLVKTAKWRNKYIETAKKILRETLARDGVHVHVEGRVKSMYSIFRKMNRKNKNSVQDIFDVFAMRVILPDIYKYGKEYSGHLYTALGIIHNHFTPLANRFKDYVAVPKVNGYRSLHTTVMGLGPKDYTQPTEIQLRTEAMHQASEFGIAAHWIYELGDERAAADPASFESAIANNEAPLFKQHQAWISMLRKIEQETKSNQEFLEHLQVDVFQDRIFVLTPRGDVKDLPAAATPIDFAYGVHTEIGNRCIAAKVNGNIVPLDYELKSGEVVEIVTRKNSEPSYQWLAFVKTNHAKNRIRAWFRNMDGEKHLRAGRDLLNEKLQQLGRPLLDDTLSLLRSYSGKNLSRAKREDILIELGKGVILASTVIRKIFTLEELLASRLPIAGDRKQHTLKEKEDGTVGTGASPALIIGGEKNMPYHFVRCCNASFADELSGYVTRGRGISIHKKDCPVVRKIESNRLVAIKLDEKSSHYSVQVGVVADDRFALIRDISHIIAGNSVNILHFFQEPPKNGAVALNFILDIAEFDQLERLLTQLEKIPSVRRAFKVN